MERDKFDDGEEEEEKDVRIKFEKVGQFKEDKFYIAEEHKRLFTYFKDLYINRV